MGRSTKLLRGNPMGYLDSRGLAYFWEKVKAYADDRPYLVKAPVGTIVVWSGTVEDIPTGWALCDGQDGRPDLRGRFVLGAGGTYNPGAAGGSEEVTLTVEQLARHSHGQYVPASATGSTSTGYTNLVNPASTSNPVSGRPYKDGLFDASTNANQVNTKMQGNNEPHENMPPYYALCYIIKVSADETDGGTFDHQQLTNRDAPEQHPIGSISGLEKTLNRIPEPVEALIILFFGFARFLIKNRSWSVHDRERISARSEYIEKENFYGRKQRRPDGLRNGAGQRTL